MYDDLLNMRYEDFCTSPDEDDGCFGLAIEVCRRMGKYLPDYRLMVLDIANQEKIEQIISVFEKINQYESGDLVLIKRMDGDGYHIGVMIEPGHFLQATRESGVRKVRINNPLVKDRIEGIYRHVEI